MRAPLTLNDKNKYFDSGNAPKALNTALLLAVLDATIIGAIFCFMPSVICSSRHPPSRFDMTQDLMLVTDRLPCGRRALEDHVSAIFVKPT